MLLLSFFARLSVCLTVLFLAALSGPTVAVSQNHAKRTQLVRAEFNSRGNTVLGHPQPTWTSLSQDACQDDSNRRRSGTSCSDFLSKHYCHFGEPFSFCKGTCGIAAPCDAKRVDIQFGGESRSTAATGALQRNENIKALTCSDTKCSECTAKYECWHGIHPSTVNGHMALALSQESTHNKHRALLWVRCATVGGNWAIWAIGLQNGDLEVHVNEKLFKSVSASQVATGIQTVQIPIEKDSLLTIDFTRTNTALAASAELFIFATGIDPYVDSCMDAHMCLDKLSDGTSGFALRNSNSMQWLCLEAADDAARDLVSPKCTIWEQCLAQMQQKDNVRTFLEAALPDGVRQAAQNQPGVEPGDPAASEADTIPTVPTVPVDTQADASAGSSDGSSADSSAGSATAGLPTQPGCYLRLPSGCPGSGAQHFTAPTWKIDSYGEEHKGAADNRGTCLQQRKGDLDGWCQTTDCEMHFVPKASLVAVSATDCIDPSVDDPEMWDCNCFENMKAACGGVDATCFRCHMCESAHSPNSRICPQWSQLQCDTTWTQQHCSASLISTSNATTHSMIQLKAAMGTRGSIVGSKGAIENGLDGSLSDKCDG